MAKQDLNQKVTDAVIKALESGVPPWNCPMETDGENIMPSNGKTGNFYSGINTLMLWIGQQEKGFTSSRWLTYKQAQELGGQVKKGEKSTPGIFYKTLEKETGETDKSGEEIVDRIPMMKGFSLFNLDQIEGLEELKNEAQPTGRRYDFTPIEAGERLMVAGGVTVHEGGANAFYRPSTDEITMPDRARFADNADFYRVFAHELTHATKHSSRCDRKPYESKLPKGAYAFEELVAQLGSAMVSAQIGLPAYIENDAAYIKSWITALRNDKKLIFKAAAQAQKATDWIMAEFDKEESAGE